MVRTENARQFCRKGIHPCTPVVTLTYNGGKGRLHWCADHIAAAERYAHEHDGIMCHTPTLCAGRLALGKLHALANQRADADLMELVNLLENFLAPAEY
jgi:hypothetical protein